jgi:hypothetical protein
MMKPTGGAKKGLLTLPKKLHEPAVFSPSIIDFISPLAIYFFGWKPYVVIVYLSLGYFFPSLLVSAKSDIFLYFIGG